MEIEVKISKDPETGISFAKFGRRRIYIKKTPEGDNWIIFKTLHYLNDSLFIQETMKNRPNYFDTAINTRFGYITTKTIVISDEAIDILKYLKDNIKSK